MDGKESPGSDGLDEAMLLAIEQVRSLAVSIIDTPATDEHVWYRNLLLGILNSALLDYRYVEIGARQKSAYLAAWSCRNLLELSVITTYVLASAENAADFKNDFLIDVKEFYEAIGKRQKAIHPKLLSSWENAIKEFEGPMRDAMEAGLRSERERGPQTEDTDTEAQTFGRLMVEFGIKRNAKPKTSGQIAMLISQSEEFQPIFKVCSKIMHRTALSIASSVTIGGLDEVIPLLQSTAACELLSIHELINTHFQEKGIHPPDN